MTPAEGKTWTLCNKLEVAVHDFMKTWLIDRKPEESVPYFSPTANDCLLELHGRREGKDDTLATIRLLHEMQLTSHLLGEPAEESDLWKIVSYHVEMD